MEREKRIESRLREYPNIDFRLTMLAQKLDRVKMKGSPRDISAVDFGKVGSGGSGASGNAVTILKETQDIINTINELEFERATIQQVVEKIREESEEQYNFIDYYYYRCTPIMETAELLGYSYNSRNTIYNIKNLVIEKCDKYGL